MNPIGIGLVGLGKIARDQHVPALRANPDFAVRATASADGAVLEDVSHAFADVRDLLTVPGLDAVAVLTPPGPRHAIARAALLAGKHVLLEKPPAATLSELADLAALAAAKRVTLFTAWHAKAHAAVDEARARLEGRRLTRLQVTWREDVRRWHPGQTWVFEPGNYGVFDPGINALSILSAILPGPVFVTAASLSFPAGAGAPIAAELTFGAGGPEPIGSAQFDWRQTGPQTWDIEVEAEGGPPLALRHGGARLEVGGAPVVDQPSDEYPRLYARFAELVRAGASEVDEAPLRLAADAFLVGRRVEVEAFEL